MKKKFYTEIAYVIGMITMVIGCAFTERANFGMSMVVAPAYILHLKLVEYLPFFSFGMAEYAVQLLLIIILCLIVRKFKVGYLFSFVTAVLYGLLLDLTLLATRLLPNDQLWERIIYFIIGTLGCAFGVAFFMKTYIAPESYELVVKEISNTYNKKLSVVKTAYDVISLLVAVILTLSFFGLWNFKGVGIGTLITALINGFIIGQISNFMDKHLEYVDAFKLRKFFEK